MFHAGPPVVRQIAAHPRQVVTDLKTDFFLRGRTDAGDLEEMRRVIRAAAQDCGANFLHLSALAIDHADAFPPVEHERAGLRIGHDP